MPADDSDVDCDEIPESVLARFSQSQEHLDQTGTVNEVANQTSTPTTTRAAVPFMLRREPRNKTTQNVEDEDDDDEEEDDDTECITFTTALDQMTLSMVCVFLLCKFNPLRQLSTTFYFFFYFAERGVKKDSENTNRFTSQRNSVSVSE